MNSVKRFVCYYAGINLVLAALLFTFAWISPEESHAGVGMAPVSLLEAHASAPMPGT